MKNKLCVLITIILTTLASAQVELTQFAGRGKVGSTGLQFLKIGIGARAVGMGESFIALANDASAMHYNPAGLVQLQKREVIFSLIKWPADISYGYVGIVIPTERFGAMGAFVGALTTGDMKKTVPYKEWTGEYFSASDWLVGACYSRSLTDKFSIGGNIKIISEFLDNENITTWAADFGTLFDIGIRKLKFAMSITNFGPNAKFISEEFSMPIGFKIGAVMEAMNWRDNTVVVTVEGSHPNDNVEQVGAGVEYTLRSMLALRAGYRSFMKLEDKDRNVQVGADKYLDAAEPLEGLSFGAGLHLPIGGTATSLDYAYSDMGFLQNAQRLTITFNF